MSSLYAYGCSFTNYKWDTWADYMGKNFDMYVNHGQPGAGNQYILQKLAGSHAGGDGDKITDKDTVAIMWSTTNRYDNFFKGKWDTPGNVFNSHYDESFTKYIDPVGFEIRDCAFIHSAKCILELIGCRFVFFSLNEIYPHAPYENTINQIMPSTKEILFKGDYHNRIHDFNTEPSNYEIHAGEDWPTREQFETENLPDIPAEIKKEMCSTFNVKSFKELIDKKMWRCPDFHPTPAMHLEYLNAVLPDWDTWS